MSSLVLIPKLGTLGLFLPSVVRLWSEARAQQDRLFSLEASLALSNSLKAPVSGCAGNVPRPTLKLPGLTECDRVIDLEAAEDPVHIAGVPEAISSYDHLKRL